MQINDSPQIVASSPANDQAMAFCGTKKYHVVHNNCIHACDFLVRVLTGGLVRSAPLIYDALCGEYPPIDPPMLMMLPLLMQKTWYGAASASQSHLDSNE